MNKAGVLQYLLSDHLHSSMVVLNQSGGKLDEIRYREASRSGAEWVVPYDRNRR
jgi:hypothetical protein